MSIELFAVQNDKGQWFRAYAQGRQSPWVDGIKDARIYTTPGPARATVSRFAGDTPPPKLVKLVIWETVAVDETERLSKSQAAIHRRKARQYQDERERERKRAHSDLANALERIKSWG